MRERGSSAAWLAVPAVVYLALVWLAPLAYTAGLSLTDAATFARGTPWAGASNYRALLADPGFRASLRATFIFTAGSVVLHLVAGFALAHLILAAGRLQGAVQTVLLIPWATAEIAAALAWRWVFEEESGLANLALTAMGAGPVPWRSATAWAMAALLLAHLWRGLALSAFLQAAALRRIPERLAEAARLDGAGPLTVAFRIRLPLILRALLVNAALVAVGALSTFTLPYALTGGGPLRATELLPLFTYRMILVEGRLGYGAAAAMSLLLLVAFAGLLGLAARRIARGT